MLVMKSTSNGRQPQNIKSLISQQPLISFSSIFFQILNLALFHQVMFLNHWNEDDLNLKTTKNGRRPQNMKRWISQQPLIGFSSNFKLKLRGPNQNEKCLEQRLPPMEDDLKILKVKYLCNHWSDFPQISNLSWGDRTK